MFAPDIPPWNRAFIQLERKPLNALEETLVYSFDRYLRRKGYLTKRQVEVLEGIARKHNVVLPLIPPVRHHAESSHTQEASAPLQQITMPELERRENARWLALLIDTEGAIGWARFRKGKDRIDERWRHTYTYRIPYAGVSMKEEEAKPIVDEGARLMGERAYTYERKEDKRRIRYTSALGGKARTTIRHIKPHLYKFKRLANLCLTLFKHHTYIPAEKFDHVITQLFGRYLTPREANQTLLAMTENQHQHLLKKAEKLTDLYLK